mgnify:CR=1 FL=1|tara:strand:+ start:5595 stop:6680 length:1086 start_codon:yes stop_codon:yes gene_type:complete
MDSGKRLLFVALHRPGRSPSQRFRYEQFVPYLEANGWQCDYSHILDENGDEAFYTSGAYWKKAKVVIKGFLSRMSDIFKADQYDVIFIQRETFVTGSTFFEHRFAKTKAKVVFDFDDAIWLLDISEGNKNLSWLKDPSKTKKIIGLSDLIIAGNSYLADYASRHNKNVKVLPSVIDTDFYRSAHRIAQGPITIGWSGSQTTNKHFLLAEPWLIKLKEKYDTKIRFVVLTERKIEIEGLDIETMVWNKEREVENLDLIDIGMMPLPDDDWARGKCGFKGIQYMSLSKPAVMSPVGVNPEIIEHGVNGYLAESTDEWFQCLSVLIESAELRSKIGAEGRKSIEQHYSVKSAQGKLLSMLENLC